MNVQPVNNPVYRIAIRTLAIIVTMLILIAVGMPGWRGVIGIIARLVLVVFCFTYSYWLFRSYRYQVAAWLLLVVGIVLLVTAAMGYSFNGILPLPWLFR